MDKVIAENNTIWTEEHHWNMIKLLRDSKSIEKKSDYRLVGDYKVVSLGGVDKVAKKSNGLYMACHSKHGTNSKCKNVSS